MKQEFLVEGLAPPISHSTGFDTSGGMIQVVASQRVGRLLIQGDGNGFEGPCTADPTAWSVEVVGQNGRFAGGAAQVDVFASACGPLECTEVSVSRTVRLKH